MTLASLLALGVRQASAQYSGTDPADKNTRGGPSATTGTGYGAGGDGYMRTAPPRWADALFDDVQPSKTDTLAVWPARAKKPNVLNRVRVTTPATFRLSATEETVLRLRLSALGHTEKLAQNTLAVRAVVDGAPALVLTFKAKRFKAVTVNGDTTQWLSEAQELYSPIAEGAHGVELLDARRDSTVVLAGSFAVPSGLPPR